jgi:rubrerythrin
MDTATKRKLLGEFNTMKLIEQDAHDFYLKTSTDPGVTELEIRNCFLNISEEEKHHIELVDRIMNIINNCM